MVGNERAAVGSVMGDMAAGKTEMRGSLLEEVQVLNTAHKGTANHEARKILGHC